MKKSRFSEQQIAFVLRQAEEGTAVAEVCRKTGIRGVVRAWRCSGLFAGACWRSVLAVKNTSDLRLYARDDQVPRDSRSSVRLAVLSRR